MNFRNWFESNDEYKLYHEKLADEFIQKLIEHLGGYAKNFTKNAIADHMVRYYFICPCGVYANRKVNMMVYAYLNYLLPWKTTCKFGIEVSAANNLRLKQHSCFYMYYDLDLAHPKTVLSKVPRRFIAEFKKNKFGNYRVKQINPSTWTPDSTITVSRFEPQTPNEGYCLVYVQGWLTKDERFQFQGDVEFSTKPDGMLNRIVDASALDFVTPGAEKLIIKGLNLYARRHNQEGVQ